MRWRSNGMMCQWAEQVCRSFPFYRYATAGLRVPALGGVWRPGFSMQLYPLFSVRTVCCSPLSGVGKVNFAGFVICAAQGQHVVDIELPASQTVAIGKRFIHEGADILAGYGCLDKHNEQSLAREIPMKQSKNQMRCQMVITSNRSGAVLRNVICDNL
jgi:hypothetical protein